MDRLSERKLLNAGLVRLTPHLIERYSKCLDSIGLEPVESERIDVDGIGVSPQVAAQRGNPYYLCNGLANPLAVIISPDQYNKPVFYPPYSWMRPLMRAVFDKYHKEIIDVTGTHAISCEVENGLSTFSNADDLFLLSELNVVLHIEELQAAAARQAALLEQFQEGNQCLGEDLCDSIIQSRHEHGDLRKRRIAMPPLAFSSFADFYTVAFGGAAVLRHVDGIDLLVLESEEEYSKMKNRKKLPGQSVLYLYDEDFKLFEKLNKADWVNVPVDHYRSDPRILEYKKELLLADALCDCERGIDWRAMTKSARKALLQKYEDRVPPIYFELERFAAGLRNGRLPSFSQELGYFLAEPSDKLPPQTQEVVWILLTRREPRNLLALYTVDKNAFLKRYNSWSDAKREWAAGYLAERYQHKHRLQHLQ